ncbi:alpha/beta hydrolase [Modestobacter sp. VKM Ac-2983]|uniref:alpha/beta fold hydrolase n=1 Tax=Modestobacter sp. VKM Ac-2983 TaxID=3004137 RepID=UPI0022ABA7DC|nr:alpha/beta hydrolase [Modestobacter sp. VKM Ac-2983]MCZ2807657.1 alpha/beta hydrolase [Modestobacter sp. VKM Ac-2983]
MTTYVLVHGAWGGPHAFRRVRPLLRAAGHEVFTPGLTGVGERVHLASPQVTLRTHVQDVVHHVLYEALTDVVLLGFSYGGMVVTGALEHIADRVRDLVYLDAFVPGDGDSLFSLTGAPPPGPAAIGSPWLVPPPDRAFEDPAVAAFAAVRRTPHPVGCFSEPVRLSRPLEEFPFRRTYIRATGDPGAPASAVFDAAAARARDSDAWRHREIATTHMVADNRPEELAELLLELD